MLTYIDGSTIYIAVPWQLIIPVHTLVTLLSQSFSFVRSIRSRSLILYTLLSLLLVSRSILELVGVLVLASSGLVSLGQHAPDGSRRHVTLGLSSSTSVGMVAGVHGYTSHGGSDTSPSRSAGLSERLVLMVRSRHHTDGGRGLEMHVSLFATLHSHDGLVLGGLLSNETSVGSGSSAELGLAVGLGGNGVDDGTHGDHPHGQTVALSTQSVGQHGGVGLAVELVNDVLGDAVEERLHRVTGSSTLGSSDVGKVAGLLVLEERNVAASVGVSLDPHNLALSSLLSEEINEPHSSSVSSTLVSSHDSASVATPTVSGLSGHSQSPVGLALPQVRVDGSLVPSHGGRDGSHGLELDGGLGDLALALHVDILLFQSSQIDRFGHQGDVADTGVSGKHGGLRVHKRLHSRGSDPLTLGSGALDLLVDKRVLSHGGLLLLSQSGKGRKGPQGSQRDGRLDRSDTSNSGRQVSRDESVHFVEVGATVRRFSIFAFGTLFTVI